MTTVWVKMNRKLLRFHCIKQLTIEGHYMTSQTIIRLAFLLLLYWGSHGTLAQPPARMGDPKNMDLQFMTQQRK